MISVVDVVIDELDKPVRHADDPTEVLLDALEPVSARCFRDEYLKAPCDLSAALWLASANDVSRIAGPVADRFVIIEKPQADREQTKIIVDSIAKIPLADAGLIGLDDRAIEVLANLRPRRMRLAIELDARSLSQPAAAYSPAPTCLLLLRLCSSAEIRRSDS